MQHIGNEWNLAMLPYDKRNIGNITRNINDIIISYPNMKGTEDDVNKIDHNLWLGNITVGHDTTFIKKFNIGHIIDLSNTDPSANARALANVTIVQIRDADACVVNLFQIMAECATIINLAINHGMTVLVHCKRGHHRSAAVVALYLMKYRGMKLTDAIILIKSMRPTAFRNMSCMLKTLICYESEHVRTNSQ